MDSVHKPSWDEGKKEGIRLGLTMAWRITEDYGVTARDSVIRNVAFHIGEKIERLRDDA